MKKENENRLFQGLSLKQAIGSASFTATDVLCLCFKLPPRLLRRAAQLAKTEKIQRAAEAGDPAGEPESLFEPIDPELAPIDPELEPDLFDIPDVPDVPDEPDEPVAPVRPPGLSHALRASVIKAADKTMANFIKTFVNVAADTSR